MSEPTPGISAPLLRFAEYTTALYRPPELGDCDPSLRLSRAVDIWSIGCIVFGAGCATPLMQPAKNQLSIKGAIMSWCAEWPSFLTGSNAKLHVSKWGQKALDVWDHEITCAGCLLTRSQCSHFGAEEAPLLILPLIYLRGFLFRI